MMVSREVFGLFAMLHVDKLLWLELIRGGVGIMMPQLEVSYKRRDWAEVEEVMRSARRCECESAKGSFLIEVGRPRCVPKRS